MCRGGDQKRREGSKALCLPVTVASSSEGNGGGESSALFSKFGSSLFGPTSSPQKVVTNIRGFLSNRLTGVSIPDTGTGFSLESFPSHRNPPRTTRYQASFLRPTKEVSPQFNKRQRANYVIKLYSIFVAAICLCPCDDTAQDKTSNSIKQTVFSPLKRATLCSAF